MVCLSFWVAQTTARQVFTWIFDRGVPRLISETSFAQVVDDLLFLSWVVMLTLDAPHCGFGCGEIEQQRLVGQGLAEPIQSKLIHQLEWFLTFLVPLKLGILAKKSMKGLAPRGQLRYQSSKRLNAALEASQFFQSARWSWFSFGSTSIPRPLIIHPKSLPDETQKAHFCELRRSWYCFSVDRIPFSTHGDDHFSSWMSTKMSST